MPQCDSFIQLTLHHTLKQASLSFLLVRLGSMKMTNLLGHDMRRLGRKQLGVIALQVDIGVGLSSAP
jgi:hypothetical protein